MFNINFLHLTVTLHTPHEAMRFCGEFSFFMEISAKICDRGLPVSAKPCMLIGKRLTRKIFTAKKRRLGPGELEMRDLEPVRETIYLSAGNAPQYRRIMRIFFMEYEKMHFQLYKEDVFELLRECPECADYSMEQLKLDLEALVGWKNLVPIQDPKRVYTIAEYKNKQFRYTMSDAAVEVERMTVRLETLFMESGNLSMNYFVRLEEALGEMEQMSRRSLREVNEWWSNFQEDFKRLNRNYQDYLREFYSGSSEKVLKSVEFVIHKDRFISYLQEFIRQLQSRSMRIERRILSLPDSLVKEVLDRVVESELAIPHPDSQIQSLRESSIRDSVYGRWDSVKGWFLSTEKSPSESRKVLDITDEIIRKIIQNAALIVQLQNWGISRKDDYKKFLELFGACESLEEAHKLSAHVFGIRHVRHLRVDQGRSTDATNSSVFEEEPSEYEVKPHTRTYRPRIQKSGFGSKALEKAAQRNQYLRGLEEDRDLVLRYIRDKRLDICQITDCIPAATRETLLRWIAQANLTSSKSGRTEYGQAFRLIRGEGTHTLCCEDGDLEIPAYILEFEGE